MRLLLVEDATIYLILLQNLLENEFQITLAKNVSDAKKIIDDKDYDFDVMIMDLLTPGTLDLIRQIKKDKRVSQIPIVALTVSDDPKDQIQAFDYGVYDCITKPIYEEVVIRRIKNAAYNYRRLKELIGFQEVTFNNGRIDELTKIYQLDTAKWLIDEKLGENKDNQKLLFIFKIINLNKVYLEEGKNRGDSLVKEISEFISTNFRNIDILGRVKEDEFICFVNNAMTYQLAIERKKEMLRLFKQKKLSTIAEDVDLKIEFVEENKPTTYQEMYEKVKANL